MTVFGCAGTGVTHLPYIQTSPPFVYPLLNQEFRHTQCGAPEPWLLRGERSRPGPPEPREAWNEECLPLPCSPEIALWGMHYGSRINARDANGEGSMTRSTRLISQPHSGEEKLKGGEGWARRWDVGHLCARLLPALTPARCCWPDETTFSLSFHSPERKEKLEYSNLDLLN